MRKSKNIIEIANKKIEDEKKKFNISVIKSIVPNLGDFLVNGTRNKALL